MDVYINQCYTYKQNNMIYIQVFVLNLLYHFIVLTGWIRTLSSYLQNQLIGVNTKTLLTIIVMD